MRLKNLNHETAHFQYLARTRNTPVLHDLVLVNKPLEFDA